MKFLEMSNSKDNKRKLHSKSLWFANGNNFFFFNYGLGRVFFVFVLAEIIFKKTTTDPVLFL